MEPSSQKNRTMRKNRLFLAGSIVACAAAFGLGWFFGGSGAGDLGPHPLRLTSGGYKFISPLLACNFNSAKIFPESQSIQSVIQKAVSQHMSQGDIEKASVYFTDFSNGDWANVNGDEKYYPSSLSKVPIMVAYLAIAENSSTILNDRVLFPVGSPDLNATQEIKPESAIIPGETYTVEQLIEYMIRYSDNNAAQLLYEHANQDELLRVYSDLNIPVNNDVTTSTLDFMTPQQYSILLRTLYNATYLSRDASEDALNLMSNTSFKAGLVAGVPNSTVVSHKFGIVSFENGVTVSDRELHDCGIVYAPDHPYLLCIMTRGSSDLASMEGTLSDISSAVYQAVENGR